MGGYCARQDLVDRIGEALLQELTDLERAGEVNEDRLERAIGDATARIDSYALLRYPAPFSPVPPRIRSVCVDLVLHSLFARRGFNENTADEAIIAAERSAVKWLEQLAEGRVGTGEAQPAKDPGVIMQSRPPIFARDKMEGF